MQILILLGIAIVVGYWLARSRYHESIDKAFQRPKNWWDRKFRQPTDEELAVDESKIEEDKEK